MTPGGLFCSATKPAVHDLHAVQRRRSMSIAHLLSGDARALRISSCMTVSSSLPSNIYFTSFVWHEMQLPFTENAVFPSLHEPQEAPFPIWAMVAVLRFSFVTYKEKRKTATMAQ